jgi:hypothetical protein
VWLSLRRATGRDISEKIALGLAKPTLSKDAMLDSRLFNQEQLAGSFADDDAYHLYDKPLFSGSSAAAAIYKPRGANIDDEGNDVSLEEGISKSMQNDRFGLGVAGRGFEGADATEVRDGYVSPFPVSRFIRCCKLIAGRLLVQSRRVRKGHGRSVRSRRVPRDGQGGREARVGYVQGRLGAQTREGLRAGILGRVR